MTGRRPPEPGCASSQPWPARAPVHANLARGGAGASTSRHYLALPANPRFIGLDRPLLPPLAPPLLADQRFGGGVTAGETSALAQAIPPAARVEAAAYVTPD